jgi:hypothetical protein
MYVIAQERRKRDIQGIKIMFYNQVKKNKRRYTSGNKEKRRKAIL